MDWAEETWVTDLKLFLTGIGAGIVMKKQWQQQIQRENNSFIMDYILEDCEKGSHNNWTDAGFFLTRSQSQI